MLTVRSSDDSIVSASTLSLFVVFCANTIINEPLYLVGEIFAWTCILTIARTLLNFKVTGQRSTFFGFSDILPLR